MEGNLKDTVREFVEKRLGHAVVISHSEWEDAKKDTLSDIYANKICFFENISLDYFIDTMVGILAARKKAAKAS